MRRERTIVIRSAKCRVPHCPRKAECRGLCRSCYQSAYLLVSSGAISWSDLEQRGKVDVVRTAKEWFLASK